MRISYGRRVFSNRSGFTLLELLIAGTITAIIVVLILSAFQVASKAWAVGERRGESTQRTRVAISHLVGDIKSAYPSKVRMFEQAGRTRLSRVLLFSGLSDSISFVTKESGISGEENAFGVRSVTYFVNSSGADDEAGLVVREGNPFVEEPFENGVTFQLDPNVTAISFRYFFDPNIRSRFSSFVGKVAEREPGEWLDEWDSYGEGSSEIGLSVEQGKEVQRFLPKSVEITMTVIQDGEERTLEPFIVPIMNRQISLSSGIAEVEEF